MYKQKPSLLYSAIYVVSLLLSPASLAGYTLTQFKALLESKNIIPVLGEVDVDLVMDFEYADRIIKKQGLREISKKEKKVFKNLIKHFSSPDNPANSVDNLMNQIIAKWPRTKNDKPKTVGITTILDGSIAYFDDGLWILFDNNEQLLFIRLDIKLSLPKSDDYRKIFGDVFGESIDKQLRIHFSGEYVFSNNKELG